MPLVVAINKCDKPQADPTRAMRSLLQFNIVPESMGGDVQCIQISALQGTNIDALQEAILTQVIYFSPFSSNSFIVIARGLVLVLLIPRST